MTATTVEHDKPVPRPTDVSAPFWEGLARGEILIQYSPSADRYVFYPRSRTPGTLTDDLEWRRVSGHGEVFTFTVGHKPTIAAWAHDLPQTIAVVRLDEGPHLVTELVGVNPSDLRVGLRVRPLFVQRNDVTLLHYTVEDSDG